MRDTGGFSFLPFLSPLGTWIMKIYISVMGGFFEVDASTSILWVNFKSNVLGQYAINLKIFGGNDKKTA